MKNEVVISNNMPADQPELSPYSMMITAVEKGLDIDKIERMMELQEKFEQNQARKAYFAAVAEFKKNPPVITKDSHVRYEGRDNSVTEYDHASHYNVISTIGMALSKHGLSLSFKQTQDSDVLTVTCTLTHCAGYSESTSLSSSSDKSGGKNSIQAIASANTYLQRYTALAITGMSTQEFDDDGAGAERLNDSQKNQIIDLMSEKNLHDNPGFMNFLSNKLKRTVESVDDFYSKDFDIVVNEIGIANDCN